jgi:hypothetical protein
LFQFPWLGSNKDFIIILVIISMLLAYALPLVLKLLMDRFLPESSWWHAVFYALISLAIILYTNSSNPDFIYFRF